MPHVRCPRCVEPLQPVPLYGVHVDLCASCLGTLIVVSDLIPLLRDMSREVLRDVPLDHPIDPLPDDHAAAPCPTCGETMERFGYMGTHLVTLDRCSACQLIWADCNELSVMCELFARTDRRGQDGYDKMIGRAEEQARRVSALLIARALSNALV